MDILKKVSKKILTYTVIFEPVEEGGYVASVPALPGCATQGESFEEAVEMVQDAISGYLAVLRDNKQDIPREKDGVKIDRLLLLAQGLLQNLKA